MLKKTNMRKDAKKTLDNLLKMSRDDQEHCVGLFLLYKVYTERMLKFIYEHEEAAEIVAGVYRNSIAYMDTLEKFKKEFK